MQIMFKCVAFILLYSNSEKEIVMLRVLLLYMSCTVRSGQFTFSQTLSHNINKKIGIDIHTIDGNTETNQPNNRHAT